MVMNNSIGIVPRRIVKRTAGQPTTMLEGTCALARCGRRRSDAELDERWERTERVI